MRRRVAVIGGGVSGLAAAHHLQEIAPELDVLLFEASGRVGGVIQTTKQDGFLIESAADNFITTPPSGIKLCQRLGLKDDLIGTSPTGRKAMVVSRGRLEPIPEGFLIMAPSRIWPLASTRTLGVFGKLRAGWEYFVPRKYRDEDESLRSFVCRRFGKELFDRLVQPLVGGIYTADPEKLSVAATMPRFLTMEREHGSLIRAMLKAKKGKPKEKSSGARYGQFATLRGGMSTLLDAMVDRLPAGTVHLNAPVTGLTRNADGQWTLSIGGDSPRSEQVDGVIVAIPARHASELLRETDAKIADELGQIEYASCAVLSMGYRRDQISHPLNAFGFVVPIVEDRQILSCSFSSVKYEGRAPEDHVLLRVYIGGACQSELLEKSDDELIRIAKAELADLIGLQGDPVVEKMSLQRQAMPQYHVGHCDRIALIERRLEPFPTLGLAGNSLHGVGIPGCVDTGESAAQSVAKAIRATSGVDVPSPQQS
ncbi:protoporphyrinogen oxidase [Novipirellula artificiosorum]|uniref:Protoporphyrinogen oxidase n=1 Tax=Novipirellula artificiosorum TaxID=2528016 RepID=A0A5C6DBR6_9BACT|nr:protoporphyrinogen oxidase [Novipirellula artificiosorum]TWU33294.1 Protoporphyrinogen oxidase [Novipirellula artificiosorum]